MANSTRSMRVLVYARVSDIPGHPQARHLTLGSLVSRHLGRDFNANIRPPIYDHVHIPADFDSEKPLERWFIFDLNVREALPRSDLLQLPHLVYFASRQGDQWIFLRRDNSIEKAKSKAASFAWGGRSEQRLFAELRAEISQDVS
ncbi:hypothetical protein BDW74DRAFT_182156 [Aspergillus multicolor]|uniref:uncharacterized protein n=1 Tax=Aspergillus multicolor TaxID=41759 RepID=UPI003CCD78B8